MWWVPNTHPPQIAYERKVIVSKKQSTGGAYTISSEAYHAMVATMQELAFRGREEESLVLRIAKAGDIKEVVKHITRLRKYGKTHAKEQPAPQPAPPKRSKSGKKKPPAGTEGGQGGDSKQASLAGID